MQLSSTRGDRLGMPVMAASSVLFSLMSVLIPLAHGVSASLIASARFMVGIAVILGIALVTRTRLEGREQAGGSLRAG